MVEPVETPFARTGLDKLDHRWVSVVELVETPTRHPLPHRTDLVAILPPGDARPNRAADTCRMAYMYILSCADGSFYVGSTVDLDRRLEQHRRGEGARYTQHRLPVELVYFEECSRIDDAFAREKQVQGWGRAKRLALIEGRLGDLPGLSRSRGGLDELDHR